MKTPDDGSRDPSRPVPPEDDIVAGEYVLGVLEEADRRQARDRIDSDPDFARRVAWWETRLSPWLLRVPAAMPGAQVWPRIRSRLGWPAVRPQPVGAWNSLRFWRTATALATAAMLLASFGLLLRGPSAPAPPAAVVETPTDGSSAARPVTVLAREDGSTAWIATIDVAGAAVLMVPVPSPASADGRVNELWVIAGNRAPVSLGFVSSELAHSIPVPPDVLPAMAAGATLAVTLEPEAGIPHAGPTGPVIAEGSIRDI